MSSTQQVHEQQVNAAISKVTQNDIEAEKMAREQAIRAKEAMSDVGLHPVAGATLPIQTTTNTYIVNTNSPAALDAELYRQEAQARLAADVNVAKQVAARMTSDTQEYLADTAKIAQAQAAEVVGAAARQAQQAAQVVQEKAAQVTDQAVATLEVARQQAAQAVSTAQEKAVEVKDATLQKAQEAQTMIVQTAEAAKQQATQAVFTAQEKAVEVKDATLQKAQEAQTAIAQTASAVANQAVAAKDAVVDTAAQTIEATKQYTAETVAAAQDIANATGKYMENKLEEAKIATAEGLVNAADRVLGDDARAHVAVTSAVTAQTVNAHAESLRKIEEGEVQLKHVETDDKSAPVLPATTAVHVTTTIPAGHQQ